MLTQNFLFGMNLLSLAGFAVMGVSLTLQRQQKLGTLAVFALMAAGTALLLVGFYLAEPVNPPRAR
jgi:hypothetical membrane protein